MLAEHQTEAVGLLDRMLLRGAGAILADAPGTGKTLVALAIAARWRERGAAVEIIVPAAIREQWTRELGEADVAASLFTHDAIAGLPFVPQPVERLLIVDEAHAFRNPETQRYDALARRTIAARVLLVTATPFCNRAADLRALLALIAPDDAMIASGIPSVDAAFESRDFVSIAAVIDRFVVRRGREIVPPKLQFGMLIRHRVPYRVTAASLVEDVARLTFPLIGEEAVLRRLLLYRLQSGLAAFTESLRRQQRFHERALEALRAGRSLGRSEYRRFFGREDEEGPAQQVLFWDAFLEEPARRPAEEIEAELAHLVTLQRTAAGSTDEKLLVLQKLIGRLDVPVIVFTSFIATARAVARMLKGAVVATGESQRGAALALDAFVRGRSDILVTTDVAAEGLNLQRAGCVIHYDLPWNPVKLDQRNGRAHRIGQLRTEVMAYYFVEERDSTGVASIVATKNQLRQRIERTRAVPVNGFGATMRPRLERDDPAWRFAGAVAAAGLRTPDAIARRNRAGLDRLLADLVTERIDRMKLRGLEQLVLAERRVTGAGGSG